MILLHCRPIGSKSCVTIISIAILISAWTAQTVAQDDVGRSAESAFVLPKFEQPASTAQTSIKDLLSQTDIPGMSVSVYADGRLAWSEGFGFADRERKTPATRATVYRIGSISKLLTTAALARLYQEGRIDLDAPISKYVPDYPDSNSKITARQLAAHTAGVRHYAGPSEFLTQTQCDDVLKALDIFKGDPLLFEPGTKYAYSSYGYVLLSAAIQGAARMPFAEYVQESVLKPLDMERTSPEQQDASIAQRSALYNFSGGKAAPAPAMNISCRLGAGGYLSTADDLARLASSHGDGSFLKKETVNLMFTPQKLENGTETEVGIGWRVAKDEAGRRFVHHGGDIIGGRAFVLLYPDSKLAVAMCSNLGNAPFGKKEALLIAAPFLNCLKGGP